MGVYIIAEAGVNHNGNLELAKKLVDLAVKAKADAVKFQTFKAEECTGEFANKAKYQIENTEEEESQLEMTKKLELPFEDFRTLKKYCEKRKIDFISTPDGEKSLNYLVSLNVKAIKIGSTEITNLEFLKDIATKKREVILSTGMSYLGEVERAIGALKNGGAEKITLLHCSTDYPTKVEDVNLKAMVTLKTAFKLPVGLSDHTMGIEAAVAAVALGAEIIEKHITLDKNMEGPDHRASMNLKEFKKYVEAIRDTEKLLGTGIKEPTEREKVIMKDVRRSIVAKKDLNKGTILDKSLIDYKRPGIGISPELQYIVLGKKVTRDLKKDEVIGWKDLS